jgi:ribonucleoside-diphosphate reductase alpha chain
MTGVAYATSAEMAGELGPFPDYEPNAEHMLRVIRNHRRAAHGEASATRALGINPVPLDHASLPRQPTWSAARAPPGTTRSRSAKSTATATPRSR